MREEGTGEKKTIGNVHTRLLPAMAPAMPPPDEAGGEADDFGGGEAASTVGLAAPPLPPDMRRAG